MSDFGAKMALMADWVYPVNERSPRWDDLPLLDYFKAAEVDDWRLVSAYRKVAVGDRIWVYASRPYQRVIGVGNVVYGPWASLEDGEIKYRVDIEWDRSVNEKLVDASGLDPLDRPPQRIRLLHPEEMHRLERWLLVEGAAAPQLPRGRLRRMSLVTVRQGQGEFRDGLLVAYEGRCAVSGCTTVDALQAAHINDYDGPATNKLSNGLLLRADLHLLFDLGLMWIDENYKVRFAAKLTDPGHCRLAGRTIRLPRRAGDWPSKDALRTHRENALKKQFAAEST